MVYHIVYLHVFLLYFNYISWFKNMLRENKVKNVESGSNLCEQFWQITFCQRLRDFAGFLVSLLSCALVRDTSWIVAIVAWRIQDLVDCRRVRRLFPVNWPRRRWRGCQVAAAALAVRRSAKSQVLRKSRCSLLEWWSDVHWRHWPVANQRRLCSSINSSKTDNGAFPLVDDCGAVGDTRSGCVWHETDGDRRQPAWRHVA